MTASSSALEELARNRFLQKKYLVRCSIPTPEFRLARNHRELVVAHQALGFPGILKLEFADGDQIGPWVVRDFPDVPPVLRETRGLPLLWERLIEAARVFRLHATRDADGSVRITPEAPAPALGYAATIGESLGIVGAYSLVLLQIGDRLLVDEIVLNP